ncbi:MAG: hypothetical protein ACFCD0_00490 [Gemmataceae bacterium]
MKKLAYWIGGMAGLLLVGIGITQFGGCGGSDEPETGPTELPKPEMNIRSEVAKIAARSDVNLQTANEIKVLVNTWLTESPNEVDQIRSDATNLDFLRKNFRLPENLTRTLGEPTLSALDAWHLAFCYQQREVYASLLLNERPPLTQVKLAFDWAMRRVYFDSTSIQIISKEGIFSKAPFLEILPPEFVLQRGSGNARERALVFLSLVRQLGLRGCAISVQEESEKRFVFAGVLVPKEGSVGDIYLFDTRLGTPVPSPDGKGIATFKQLKTNSKVLERVSKDRGYPLPISNEDVKKLKALVACPLSTMSARMRFLEDFLSSASLVDLGVSPEAEWKALREASEGNVGVWHQQVGSGTISSVDSAVLVLHHFIQALTDPETGEGFSQKCQNETVPLASILREYQTKLWNRGKIPARVKKILLDKTSQLVAKYILLPHRELVRGHPKFAIQRLTQLGRAMDRYESSRLTDTELDQWCRDVERAYAKDTKNPDEIPRLLESLWFDEYLEPLLAMGGEAQELPRKLPKRRLTRLLMTMAWSTLSKEQRFLLTKCRREAAELLRGRIEWNRQRNYPIPEKPLQTLNDSWRDTSAYGREYESFETVSITDIRSRLEEFAAVRYTPFAWGECAALMRKLNRFAAMQLERADVLIRLNETTEAKQKLQALIQQIQRWRAMPELAETRRKLLEGASKAFPILQQLPSPVRNRVEQRIRRQIENIFASLEDGGSLEWIAYGAKLRLEKL